jgi:hypothetical protein
MGCLSSVKIGLRRAIETHAADGFGSGLTVSIPKTRLSPKVRALERLDDARAILAGDLGRNARIVMADLEGRIAGCRAPFPPSSSGKSGLQDENGKGVASKAGK